MFLWNRGVASRGKMMEKTFPATPVSKTPLVEPKPGLHAKHVRPPLPVTSKTAANVPGGILVDSLLLRTQLVAVEKRLMYDSLHAGLTDPHFCGLNNTGRYYLYCFGTDTNQSLVLYDMPGENPFESLVPYAEHHEPLQQIIIATAALHTYRMYRPTGLEQFDHGPRCLESSLEFEDQSSKQHVTGRTLWHPLQDTYRDSLAAKQKALRLLAKAIQKGNVNDDIISICMLLFVHFELMRPRSSESHVHLKGAQTLFKSPRPSKRAVQTVRNTVISDCVLFDTMELMLDPTRPRSSSIRHSLLPLFESTGTSNHITFPLEILHSLTAACESLRDRSLNNTSDIMIPKEVELAIQRILIIDAHDWAESFHRIHMYKTCPGGIETRIHLCEAHKAASVLFLARVANCISISSYEIYHIHLLEYLGYTMHGQYLFKASSWPAFIAGLEAKDERIASLMIERLLLICSVLPYGFVRRAVRMLKRM
jgi:hypothetical protein